MSCNTAKYGCVGCVYIHCLLTFTIPYPHKVSCWLFCFPAIVTPKYQTVSTNQAIKILIFNLQTGTICGLPQSTGAYAINRTGMMGRCTQPRWSQHEWSSMNEGEWEGQGKHSHKDVNNRNSRHMQAGGAQHNWSLQSRVGATQTGRLVHPRIS